MIAEPDLLGASILIVDDQDSNIQFLTQMLADAGYRHVSSTMQPHEVGLLHRKHPYDLILLDLQMPGMDGFQVMETLRANLQDPYLPVLVITAQPDHKLRALQAGALDFISKPFDLTEARTRIRNMLQVCLLNNRLKQQNLDLERMVEERTAELRESQARYRSLTELATDWYWEQDDMGNFTKVSGPVLEMLGLQVEALSGVTRGIQEEGWNPAEREVLQSRIAAREPFLDFVFSRTSTDGSVRKFRVSGEPMLDRFCRYIGYRGVGVEIIARQSG